MRAQFALAAAVLIGSAVPGPFAVPGLFSVPNPLGVSVARAEEPIFPVQASRNMFGNTGLIDTPTAEMQRDAELGFTASYFGGYQRNTLTVQALPWLELSFRYAALHNMLNVQGHSKTLYDRSFDAKFRLMSESPLWPSLAFGLRDFLGTGVYSGEYFAGTKNFFDGDLKVTGGLGWGRFAGTKVHNPLCRNYNRFCSRSASVGTGGTVGFGSFLSGQHLGFFGGVEWRTPLDGLRLKVEYSDDQYTRERKLGGFKRKSGINVGAEYTPIKGVSVGAYYMYGSEVGLRLSLSANPFDPISPIDSEPAPVPLKPRPTPAPGPGAKKLGPVQTAIDNRPVTTAFVDTGVSKVDVPERKDGVRWAQAVLPPSADYVCPDDAAKAIDAEFGVIDAVTFRHADGTLVCTVALRPAGVEAIRRASRPDHPYPTDWFKDEAKRQAAVDALAKALKPDEIGLFGIDLAPERVTVYIENGKFRATPRAIGRTARALSSTMPASVELFEIVPVVNNLPTVSVTLRRSELEREAERPDAARAAWLMAQVDDAALPNWSDTPLAWSHFPRFSWSFGPEIPVNLFDPSQPFRYSVRGAASGKLELLPGLSLNGSVTKDLIGNLKSFNVPPDSKLPHVRSDIAQYIRQGDPALAQLTADYVTKLRPDTYARLSAGLLEPMYGGVSAEVLWKPAAQTWGLGAEINWVKQRGFDERFDFRSYSTVTGHVSAYWDTSWHGVSAQVDVGKYLARDWGATFSLKRRFANGWQLGGFFTLTNVPFNKFGEGSFDKGLTLTIPFNWFMPYESQTDYNLVLRPLTRDGGQRVEISNRLYPMVEDMDRGGLHGTWGSFWQ